MLNNTQSVDESYRCYLGMGSNLTTELGSPAEHIQQAAQSLKGHHAINYVRLSSLYQSVPLGPQDQPDFVNAVVEVDTTLSPLALLQLCQQLEQQAQRVRLRHWGERSLDVDILLYGDKTIDLPQLTVPHLGVLERNFVLIPLAELNPKLSINGTSIKDIPLSLDWTGLKKL